MEEAAELYEHAIRIRTDVLGGTNEDTWMSTNNLALVLQRLDRVDEAEMVFRKAIQAMQVRSGVAASDAEGRRLSFACTVEAKK